MPLIAEHLLDEIQSRADLAELIGRYVPLKRAGRHFKALCPFHKERTPSFHINTDKQIFHCFGCGVGGNIFSFLMQQDRLTFPEAVRQVAQHVGVTIPEAPADARNGQTDALVGILEKACQFYQRRLAHPSDGRTARAYLAQRGVTARTRETFRVGCAPDGWDALVRAAHTSHIAPELLEQAGLVLRGPRGTIDRFRSRLLFPIEDVRGRVIAFGGRSLAGQEPKYLNSPESPVYIKGRQLFGLAQAKDAIAQAKAAVVVEGYFDCVLLWQEGIAHTVSASGTAFTPEQARLLLRYTDQVILAFDPDAAGEAATLRGIEVLVEAGFQVRVAQLPTGIDPDELIRQRGREAVERLLTEAPGVMDFLLACAVRRYPVRQADGKVRAAQWLLPTVAKAPNAIRRAEYVRLLAERLGLDERAVLEELRKVKPRGESALRRDTSVRAAASPRPAADNTERLLVGLLVDQPARWSALQGQPVAELISDSRLQHVTDVVAALYDAGQHEATAAQIISRLPNAEGAATVSDVVALAQTVRDPDAALADCLRRLRRRAQKRQQDQLRAALGAAQQQGQHDEVTRLLRAYQHSLKGGTGDGSGEA